VPTTVGQTAPPMAVAIGKDAKLYLLDKDHLGGEHPADSGALQVQRLANTQKGLWGGPCYYGAADTGRVYLQLGGGVLRAFSVATGAAPALTQIAAGSSNAGFGGSIPIVSSNGETANTGVVWLIRRGATEQLEAYDAINLGTPLFAANAGVWSPTGTGDALVTPLEANGRVYVPGYETVTVFGLTQ